MKLITERLVLRSLKYSDAKSLIENINNLEVSKWLLVVPHPYTMNDAKWWINKNKEKPISKNQKDYNFGIEIKSKKIIIGGIGLSHVDKNSGVAEVGYWLGEKYWAKGYGAEALKSVVDFAFNKLKLRRLEAGVFVGNPSSGKLLEKMGFALEGTKRQSKISKASGKINDEDMYGLLKEDYALR